MTGNKFERGCEAFLWRLLCFVRRRCAVVFLRCVTHCIFIIKIDVKRERSSVCGCSIKKIDAVRERKRYKRKKMNINTTKKRFDFIIPLF